MDLVIGADRELCGEQHVGRFTLQGGAKVTCPTGSLTVWADEILIDPASSIDLGATAASSWSGEDGRVHQDVCPANPAFSGGGGGGNNGAGTSAANTRGYFVGTDYGSCQYAFPEYYDLTGSVGGAAQDGNGQDLDAPVGGVGGQGCSTVTQVDIHTGPPWYRVYDCTAWLPGGKGGGSVRLFATRSLNVMGNIHVDGQDGVSGQFGAGGGAGGSIVLASNQLSVSGVLSAVGGAGGGGQAPWSASGPANGGGGAGGWVKLAHGSSFTNTATITGTTALESIMPPVDIRSATHPSPALAYNNTFSTFSASWVAPFPGGMGFWYALGQDPDATVSPSTWTYTTGTSVSFPSSAFNAAGTWYLSVASVDGMVNTGTMAGRYTVDVNDTPPAVTSSSHPDSATWYPNATLLVAWTPSGGAPGSFPAHWYRVDHASNTSPANARTQWTRTTNLQAIVAQDSQGAALANGAWYFHVVSEDTLGNLTQEAAHFLFRVGTQAPATTTFFGYVRDQASAPLSGATVHLEPYGLEDVTDTNGYFLFADVPEGPYAVTVSHAGHATVSQNVTVDAAISPWTVTLSP